MDINDLNFLIGEEIYVLNDIQETEEPKIEETVKSVRTYEFLILSENLSDDLNELLKKILSAVSVNIENTTRLDRAPSDDWQAHKMICFGKFDGVQQSSYFEVLKGHGGEYLCAPTLNTIADSRDEKMKLWNALKGWFNIR